MGSRAVLTCIAIGLGLAVTQAPSFSSTAAPATASVDGWRTVSDHDGIIVYERPADNSEVISMRAVTVIAASPLDIAHTIADNDGAKDWIPYVAERRTLASDGKLSRVELTHVSTPWPLKDRYFVTRSRAEQLPGGGIKMTANSIADPPAPWRQKDMVLGILHESTFVLTPTAGGTRFELQINTDPKGLIPKWLVNLTQRGWPREFFTGLTRVLTDRGQLKGPAAAGDVAH